MLLRRQFTGLKVILRVLFI